MEPIIEVKNLAKKYQYGELQRYFTLRDSIQNIFGFHKQKGNLAKNEFWALKDVSFEVNAGEAIGIIGANGAGKSTLLKILSRITPPTKGEAVLRGRVGSLLEVGTGFHQELTGRENIYLNGAVLGMRRREINKKFDEIVEFSGVEKFLDTPVKHFSSGMYMRLAFAVAAHLESRILLIDEVLAVGDSEFQNKCLAKMDTITKKEGRTVIFVSHNMSAVQNLCEKSILLKKGRINLIGKSSSVVAKYIKGDKEILDIDIGSRKDRLGNGKLKFTEVSFFNSRGKKISKLISGEDLSIKIDYKINSKELKFFDFDFAVDSISDQSRVSSINSRVFGKKITASGGPIKINIHKLPLAPGKYQFTLFGLGSTGETLDWVKRAGTFQVESGNFYKSGRIPEEGHGHLLLDYSY